MMWKLDELMDNENDTMENTRNGYSDIESFQEESFISDEEVERLVENHVPGLSDYDHEPNLNRDIEPDYKVDDKQYFLIEYIRKNNRDKKGVLIAVKHDDNEVVIGWSLCSSLDVFDKYFGQQIAYERGCKRFYDECHFEDIPPSINYQLDEFVDRCKRYFKDCKFPAWTWNI